MKQLFEFLATLSTAQLGVGLAITAAVVSIVIEWRLAMFSMLTQYLFLSLLLNTELPGGLAMVKLVAGYMGCLILYWTARQVELALQTIPDGRAWFVTNRAIYPMGLPFRILTLLFVILVLMPLPEYLSFIAFPPAFLVPSLWLVTMGLLTIILTRDPLKTGMGLLTFQNGIELLYSLVDPGVVVIGLLGICTILVGLVASYLAIARHLPLIEAQQAGSKLPDPHSPEALATAVAALEEVLALPPAQEEFDITEKDNVA